MAWVAVALSLIAPTVAAVAAWLVAKKAIVPPIRLLAVGLLIGAIGGTAGVIYIANLAFGDTDAQTGLIFVRLPFLSIAMVLCLAAVGWAIAYVVVAGAALTRGRRSSARTWRLTSLGPVALVILVMASFATVMIVEQRRQLSVASSSTDPAELEGLYDASQRGHQLLMRLAENTSTPASVLRELASDSRSSVRSRVASNENAPVDVLTALASDDKWYVRSALAGNPAIPLERLQQLANADRDSKVRVHAKWRIENAND